MKAYLRGSIPPALLQPSEGNVLCALCTLCVGIFGTLGYLAGAPSEAVPAAALTPRASLQSKALRKITLPAEHPALFITADDDQVCTCPAGIPVVMFQLAAHTRAAAPLCKSGPAAAARPAPTPQAAKKDDPAVYLAALLKQQTPGLAGKALADLIAAESRTAGVDPLFTAALAYRESSFKAEALSRAGGMGLLQINPAYAPAIAARAKVKWEGKQRLLDPRYNIKLGLAYLRYLKGLCRGNQHQVLNAFHQDPAALKPKGASKAEVPAAPTSYSRAVLELFERWKEAADSTPAERPRARG